jgi:hypothetical protein
VAPVAAGGADAERAAYEAAGGQWDADAQQGYAYRQSIGQTPEQIRANMEAEARARFAPSSGGGGSFSFASQAAAAPSVNGPQFAFDESRLGSGKTFQFKFDKAMEAIKRLGAGRGTYFNPQTTDAAQAEAVGLASQDVEGEYARQAGTFDRNFGVQRWQTDTTRQNRLDDFGIMDTNRRYERGVLESDRGFGYQQDRDRMADTWRFIDYGNVPSYAP